jgi:hypothetical protein
MLLSATGPTNNNSNNDGEARRGAGAGVGVDIMNECASWQVASSGNAFLQHATRSLYQSTSLFRIDSIPQHQHTFAAPEPTSSPPPPHPHPSIKKQHTCDSKFDHVYRTIFEVAPDLLLPLAQQLSSNRLATTTPTEPGGTMQHLQQQQQQQHTEWIEPISPLVLMESIMHLLAACSSDVFPMHCHSLDDLLLQHSSTTTTTLLRCAPLASQSLDVVYSFVPVAKIRLPETSRDSLHHYLERLCDIGMSWLLVEHDCAQIVLTLLATR